MTKILLALIISLSFTLTTYSQNPDANLSEPGNHKELTVKNDSSNTCEYCGIYQLKDNPYADEVSISMKNGTLIASAENYSEIELKETETDQYYVPDYHARIVFVRSENAIVGIKISAYSLKFGGNKLEASNY